MLETHSKAQASLSLRSLYRNLALPDFSSLGKEQASLSLRSLYRNLSLLEDGDFVEGNVGGEFVFETVDADELAV